MSLILGLFRLLGRLTLMAAVIALVSATVLLVASSLLLNRSRSSRVSAAVDLASAGIRLANTLHKRTTALPPGT